MKIPPEGPSAPWNSTKQMLAKVADDQPQGKTLQSALKSMDCHQAGTSPDAGDSSVMRSLAPVSLLEGIGAFGELCSAAGWVSLG